ncbi:hypothetical protein QW131_23110 [Roseibium salinum]|nr:hypothetical protein [Roseibium salinum]
MAETKQSGNRSVVFQLLEQHCARTGYRLHVGDSHGHAGLVESPDGRRWFFKGTHFDLNTLGASEIADDKAYAAHFLEESGIAVPASRLVFSSELGNRNHPPANVLDFAETGGFPLFVKPNVGQEGADVIRVGTYPGLTQTLHMLAKRHAQLLVQEEIRGGASFVSSFWTGRSFVPSNGTRRMSRGGRKAHPRGADCGAGQGGPLRRPHRM